LLGTPVSVFTSSPHLAVSSLCQEVAFTVNKYLSVLDIPTGNVTATPHFVGTYNSQSEYHTSLFEFLGDQLWFLTREDSAGVDANSDGDQNDNILAGINVANGLSSVSYIPMAVASGSGFGFNGDFVVGVSSSDELFFYEVATGQITQTGITVYVDEPVVLPANRGAFPKVSSEISMGGSDNIATFLASEIKSGKDLNADGDTADNLIGYLQITASQKLDLIDDNLDGWENWSWNSTQSLTTNNPFSGTHALEITVWNWGGGSYFHIGDSISTTGYSSINFAIYGIQPGAGKTDYDLRFFVADNGTQGVSINDYIVGGMKTGQWHQVSIPLVDLGLSPNEKIYRITFQEHYNSSQYFLVDAIHLQ